MDEAFYVYQHSPNHPASLHRASCPHCRNGQGQSKPHFPEIAKGKPRPGWAKRSDMTEDNYAEKALREKLRLCGHCLK